MKYRRRRIRRAGDNISCSQLGVKPATRWWLPARYAARRRRNCRAILRMVREGIATVAKDLERVDISNIPDLIRIVEGVQTSQEPRVLRRGDEDVAIITPLRPRRRRASGSGTVTQDDPLFRLIGIGKSGIPGGVSGKKHE